MLDALRPTLGAAKVSTFEAVLSNRGFMVSYIRAAAAATLAVREGKN